jgi:hypothetical protein
MENWRPSNALPLPASANESIANPNAALKTKPTSEEAVSTSVSVMERPRTTSPGVFITFDPIYLVNGTLLEEFTFEKNLSLVAKMSMLPRH